jgi:hypothetical protein
VIADFGSARSQIALPAPQPAQFGGVENKSSHELSRNEAKWHPIVDQVWSTIN